MQTIPPAMVARLRAIREQPYTPERMHAQFTHAAAIRRLARQMPTDTAKAAGSKALLVAFDPSKSDHIALAIAAHKMLAATVVKDIEQIGQPDSLTHAALLIELCLYLDSHGWDIGPDGAFHDGIAEAIRMSGGN